MSWKCGLSKTHVATLESLTHKRACAQTQTHLCGVRGPRRTRSMTFLTKPFVKCLRSKKVVYLSRGWERGMRSYERLRRRGNTLGEEQWSCRKLPKRVYLPPPH